MHIRLVLFTSLALITYSCKEVKQNKTSTLEPVVVTEKEEAISTFEDLEGKAIELSDYKGKRVLLNYWATWCRPCIEEMPDMEKAQEILEQENYIFLFASDQSIKKITDFKNKRGFNLEYIKYNGMYAEQGISALPVTFIYNEVGEQVHRFDGGLKWNSPEIIEKLRQVK
jgi:thiol-disulfide isomerase/thioredoxin